LILPVQRDPIDAALAAAHAKYQGLKEGANADHIPALAKADSNLLGIALVTVDGEVHEMGDTKSQVSMQSIAKVFTMARVFEESGLDALPDNVALDATGQAFNSIEAIERYKGQEMNPLVNAGAITATSMMHGKNGADVWRNIIDTYSDFAGRKLSVDQQVYFSESESNQRIHAIAKLMSAYERIAGDPEQAVDLYTRQASVAANAVDLATMAATLANGGKNPVSGKQVISSRYVAPTLAAMATAGLYGISGKWLFSTGLPAKSGVGGGIIAVAPGKFGIAAISPPLDKAGNSVRSQRAIADVSKALGGNPYAVNPR
jgi:glutaminase